MSYARSWLYVPGTRRDFLDSAASRGADAVILDLEDSVRPADKDAARATVSEWLPSQPLPGTELWLRLNADSAEPDVAVLTTAVAGVIVPKAETGLLTQVSELLGAREQALGMCEERRFAVIPLIETARGLLYVQQIAAAARVAHLGIGEADLAAELRLRPADTADTTELAPLRLQVVVASAAAGIGAPVGPTSTDFRDLQALHASTQALLRAGFRARTAIHPAQIPVINEVFTPSPDEVAQARQLVDSFEHSAAGAMRDADGRMADIAVVRSAREVLSRAQPAR